MNQVEKCQIQSCKGKENCLEHCPCDCHVQTKEGWKPCSCPKGGMYDDGRICEKCGGTEWVNPIQNKARALIADVVTYYDRYGIDFSETAEWDWREAIEMDFATAIQEAKQEAAREILDLGGRGIDELTKGKIKRKYGIDRDTIGWPQEMI